MKTLCAKPNPAFKRTQVLPVILNLLPATTGGAARHCPDFTPAQTGSRPQKIEFTVGASRVNPGNNRPVTRLLD
jgi:hypothetical protein